jgi:cytochrome c556
MKIKKSSVVLLLLCLLCTVVIYSCANTEAEQPKEAEMAKVSELAEMMRDMHAHAAEMREAILADSLGELPTFARQYELMNTLIPTDQSVRTPIFEGFSGLFMEYAQEIHQNKENRVYNYNNMLNACVSCHQTYCPGPIKRINKLKI